MIDQICPKSSISTEKLGNHGLYTLTWDHERVHMDLQGQDLYITHPNEILVQLIDPCRGHKDPTSGSTVQEPTQLIPTFETINLNGIIGNESQSQILNQYQDTVS